MHRWAVETLGVRATEQEQANTSTAVVKHAASYMSRTGRSDRFAMHRGHAAAPEHCAELIKVRMGWVLLPTAAAAETTQSVIDASAVGVC